MDDICKVLAGLVIDDSSPSSPSSSALEQRVVPLTRVEVTCDIHDFIGMVNVTQYYHNTSDHTVATK
jgi:hypothetical protein